MRRLEPDIFVHVKRRHFRPVDGLGDKRREDVILRWSAGEDDPRRAALLDRRVDGIRGILRRRPPPPAGPDGSGRSVCRGTRSLTSRSEARRGMSPQADSQRPAAAIFSTEPAALSV